MRTNYSGLLFILLYAAAAPGLGGTSLSPAQEKMAAAQKAAEKNPQSYESYNQWAWALSQRARETSDPAFYVQADDALKKSLALAPDNFEARKIKVWLFLGRHEFAKALEDAKVLNEKVPDDVMVYGFLSDAFAQLGNYKAAEEACQWMLDLRPGNIPALTRAAYLREIFGDIDGALDLMTQAYQRTPWNEVEDRAWILTHAAHLYLVTGNLAPAQDHLTEALKLFPDYHYALGQLAKVRIAQKKYGEAVELLEKRYRNAPHPENLYELAKALDQAGNKDDAAAAYETFEKAALRESENADNSNRELIFYYIDRKNHVKKALQLARLEATRRKDVLTLDALAWALYANGSYEEAETAITSALAVGTRDAGILYRAGRIALKRKKIALAKKYFRKSLELNARSEISHEVQESLNALEHAIPGKR